MVGHHPLTELLHASVGRFLSRQASELDLGHPALRGFDDKALIGHRRARLRRIGPGDPPSFPARAPDPVGAFGWAGVDSSGVLVEPGREPPWSVAPPVVGGCEALFGTGVTPPCPEVPLPT